MKLDFPRNREYNPTMMTVIFIGQAPGRNDGSPVSGRIDRRLAGLLSIDLETFLCSFSRTNVLDRFPGKSGKGDAFPMDEARKRAAHELSAFSTAVLLGKNTARTFGIKDPAYFETVTVDGVDLVPFPHPSGVNRW